MAWEAFMKPSAIVFSAVAVAATLAPQPVAAQYSHGGSGAPQLHVNDSYSSCFFDLHPELTKDEFQEFTAELGSILRFRQLGETTTLGKGRVDISLQWANSPIDDSKGAWNNTMSHPTADHYLGSPISFPRLVGRFGVSDRVDLGAWGGFAPGANYGFIGADSTIGLIRQGSSRPVSLSIRPSITALVGPAELWAGNASLDVSVSRAFGSLSPYVGVATTASLAVETSDDVNLDSATAEGSLAYAGLSYRWRALILSVEVEKAALMSYGFRVGTRF
jgi:hypothetical protein